MTNPKRIDPSRTGLVRRQFMADVKRRFAKVSQAIQKFVVEEDAFGLKPSEMLSFNQAKRGLSIINSGRYQFKTSPQKVAAYRLWLQQQIDAEILTVVGGRPGKPWLAKYVESAFKKGMLRAYMDVHAEELGGKSKFFRGTKEQFLSTAFMQPEVLEKVEMVFTRAFNDMKGITDNMSNQMSKVLADGFVHGRGPAEIARQMRKQVDSIGKNRALVIARTETINAHAEGQLTAFEELGVVSVGAEVEVEISTAGDVLVCEKCQDLEGKVFTTDEARGVIPVHPNCRCCWNPHIEKVPARSEVVKNP